MPNQPKEAAIYYWQLANEGMKGDTAKYRLYQQGYAQKWHIDTGIMSALLIYATAKTTHKGTVKTIKNIKEKIRWQTAIRQDAFGQPTEVEETMLFTYEDDSSDTVVTRLIFENKMWKLQWQKEGDFLMK